MKTTSVIISSVALIALLPTAVSAKPHVVLTLRASSVDIVDGTPVLTSIAQSAMHPGMHVRYTIVVVNEGTTKAVNVVPRARIPRATEFIAGSPTANVDRVEFSVDNGATWSAEPTIVVATPSGPVHRKAEISEYTDIRWTHQPPLAPKATWTYTYDVTVL